MRQFLVLLSERTLPTRTISEGKLTERTWYGVIGE